MFVTQAHAAETAVEGAAAPAAGDHAASHGGTHGETVAHEGAHQGGFPPMETEFFPSQILWLAISFGIFYLILDRVILPRLTAILDNRRDRLSLDLEAARQMKADTDAAEAAYQQELAAARDRSHKIALAAREGAKADADAERLRIGADLDAKLEAAQARIADIKRAALADVGGIAEEATQTILNAVTGIDVSRDEVSGAVASVRS